MALPLIVLSASCGALLVFGIYTFVIRPIVWFFDRRSEREEIKPVISGASYSSGDIWKIL